LHGVFCGWLTWTHHAIDGDPGGKFVRRLVRTQGLGDIRPLIKLVGVDARKLLHAGAAQLFKQGFGQLFVGFSQDFTGINVHQIARDDPADQKIFGHRNMGGLSLFQLTGVPCSDPLVLDHHHFATLVRDVKTRDLTTQTLGDKLHLGATVHQAEVVIDKKVGQNRLIVEPDGLEQDGDRHLASTVYPEVQDIFWIKFKIKPGTAVRNDPRRKQQLARAVCLALVMLKKHAR